MNQGLRVYVRQGALRFCKTRGYRDADRRGGLSHSIRGETCAKSIDGTHDRELKAERAEHVSILSHPDDFDSGADGLSIWRRLQSRREPGIYNDSELMPLKRRVKAMGVHMVHGTRRHKWSG